MRALIDKINQECEISKSLRQLAWNANYNDSIEIRKKQQFHWEKFNFMKELSKAIEKKGK